MPRYYLHIRDGSSFYEDLEGSDLKDLDAARAAAADGAREILAERVRMGLLIDGQKFEICDGAGTLLATVSFKSVLKLPE